MAAWPVHLLINGVLGLIRTINAKHAREHAHVEQFKKKLQEVALVANESNSFLKSALKEMGDLVKASDVTLKKALEEIGRLKDWQTQAQRRYLDKEKHGNASCSIGAISVLRMATLVCRRL